MLLETAVGDAYGSAFEFVDRWVIEDWNRVSDYCPLPRRQPGRYTDDTQMSLAVAVAIVEGDDWTPEALAGRFCRAFKRDERTGYARGFYLFLQSVQDEHDFLARIRPNSEKSGAAMRAGPIGVFPTVADVIERASVQAAITHNTANGIRSAGLAALMPHYFLYGHGPRTELIAFLNDAVPGADLAPWQGMVDVVGMQCVAAAATAVAQHDRLSEVLRACVAFGGDVDTVASIAMAAASCAADIEQDLPETLFAGLENGPYGRDYIAHLDARLLARVRR